MKFCDEEIEWSYFWTKIYEIKDLFDDMGEASPLQAIAFARLISDAFFEFKERLISISLKAVICEILKNYDIDAVVGEAEQMINTLFDEFNEFDSSISAITSSGFESIDEVENAVTPIFDNFDLSRNEIEKKVDEILLDMFLPLIELGASKQQIDDALESISYQSNPIDYILEVFNEIVDSTLATVN